MEKHNMSNKWLINAFRCATILKDDKLENEIYFINQVKRELYLKSLNTISD